MAALVPTRKAISVAVALSAVALFFSTGRGDGQEAADFDEAETCRAVFGTLERTHINLLMMPADFEQSVVQLYLRKLDPRKMYFLREDVAAIRHCARGLQVQLRRGDLTVVNKSLEIYRNRVRQQTAEARAMLKQEHDFTVDESISLNYRRRPYCLTEFELNERWRKTIKYELLAGRLPDETREQTIARLQKRTDRAIANLEAADREGDVELFLQAVAQTYDPHSSYLSPTTLDHFR